jgi:methyl-accepting chemotaxis protein
MASLHELLEERRKKKEGDQVANSLEALNGKVAGSPMMMFVDKEFTEAIAQEVVNNTELVEKAIEQLQVGDDERQAGIDLIKENITDGFEDLGAQIKDKDTRGKIMELSKNINGLIEELQNSNAQTQALLEKTLKQGPDMVKQIGGLAQAVQAQTDQLAQMVALMNTPKVLVTDDDGNPVGVRYEY